MFKLPSAIPVTKLGEVVGRGVSRVLDHRVSNQIPAPLITCEHASNELPLEYQWTKRDESRLSKAHWAYDPGAKEFSEELGEQLAALVVQAKYSRLLVDLNRPMTSQTLIRRLCDNTKVELNEFLTVEEIERRINNYYSPYHLTLNAVAEQLNPPLVLSVHSFTKNYEENTPRDFEVGVLSVQDDDLAQSFVEAFERDGISARWNEPYSGKEGVMHSAENLAGPHDHGRTPTILFEFRNDRCTDKAWRSRAMKPIVELTEQFMKKFHQQAAR